MRYVHDTTLSDLAHITATVNHPVSQADAKNPSIVTLTIESGLLQQILTAASLHMSDCPFVPKPEVGEYAEVIAQNNQESQDWHDLMQDAIEVITARASKAAHPNSGGIDRERSVVDRRKWRPQMEKYAKDDKAKAEAVDPNTLEGVKARWDAANIKALNDRDMVGLMVLLLEGKSDSVEASVTAQLFERLRKESQRADKAEERINGVLKALGRA